MFGVQQVGRGITRETVEAGKKMPEEKEPGRALFGP